LYSLTVVDSTDNVIGSSTYDEIHSKGILHRFVLVYVFDKEKRFFLQKRAANKVHGCMYAESVCAHVRYNEKYIETAKRRLMEELDIKQTIHFQEIIKDKVYTKDKNWINHAFVKIYECIIDQELQLNSSEIQEGEFLPMNKVINKFIDNPNLFVPGFRQTFPLYLQAKLQSNSK